MPSCMSFEIGRFQKTRIDITSLLINQNVRQIFPEGFIVGAKVGSFFELAKKNEKKNDHSLFFYRNNQFIHSPCGGLVAECCIVVVFVLCHLAELEITISIEFHRTVFLCV